MNLLVDIGNTRIKWAIRQGTHTLHTAACLHTELAMLPAQIAPWPISKVVACNVAGPELAQALVAAVQPLTVQWLIPGRERCGIHNSYTEPARLGADRWAALIGARQQREGDLLVVMAGTALTVDALTTEGVFLGGTISPGLQLMRKSLAQGTAVLGLPPGQATEFPCNTGDAIFNGALVALAGAIEHMAARLARFRGHEVSCLISGGDAAVITPWLGIAASHVCHIDNLVLEGLAVVANEEISL